MQFKGKKHLKSVSTVYSEPTHNWRSDTLQDKSPEEIQVKATQVLFLVGG